MIKNETNRRSSLRAIVSFFLYQEKRENNLKKIKIEKMVRWKMLKEMYEQNDVSSETLHSLERLSVFNWKTGGRGHWRFIIDESLIPEKMGGMDLTYASWRRWMERFYGDIVYFDVKNPNRIFVKENKMGWMIGKKGWRIKKLQENFKRKIELIQTKLIVDYVHVPDPFINVLEMSVLGNKSFHDKFIREIKNLLKDENIWDNNYHFNNSIKKIEAYFGLNYQRILKEKIWFETARIFPDLSNFTGFRQGDFQKAEKYEYYHPFMKNEFSKQFLRELFELKRRIKEEDEKIRKDHSTVFLDFSSNIPYIAIDYMSKNLTSIPHSVHDFKLKRFDIEKTLEYFLECYSPKEKKYLKMPKLIFREDELNE